MLLKKSLLALASGALLALAGCSGTDGSEYAEFAQCLSDEDIVVYGAYWCPHCADQKEMFGKSWDNITYVECDPNGENAQTERCLTQGIESYPTWIRSDGERREGTQTFEQLEEFSTCTLPEPTID